MAATAETARRAERATPVLTAVLAVALVSSAIHYTDNTVAIEAYPGPLPAWLIAVSWFLFTAVGVLGYVQFRAGRYGPAAAALAWYSISGLVTLGHYTEDTSGLTTLRHVSIVFDGVVGTAVLAFAVWCWRSLRRSAPAAV